MNGSNSLEVVRSMERASLFTVILSLILTIGMGIYPGALANLGITVYMGSICIPMWLLIYSMKQYSLWTANEARLLEEIHSSVTEGDKK